MIRVASHRSGPGTGDGNAAGDEGTSSRTPPAYADVPEELLLRYDVPGPRYTSYPTAPVWKEDFGPSDWAAALRRAGEAAAEPLSLYVHLPFCRSLCFYCGCSVVVTQDTSKAQSYVDLLLAEARLVAAHLGERRRLLQHHWGGGTPTFLPPDEVARLYCGLSEIFPIAPGAEVSIEIDPRVTTFEHLRVLAELGFNRLSVGIQDFTPRVQEAIHRVQTREQTLALIEEARRLGFTSINGDLVYGLPYQEPATFAETLDTVIGWGLDRFACYSYAHVPWMKKNQKALPVDALPSREAKFALLALALHRFSAAGYVAIGFDHFAKPEDSLAQASADGRLHRNFQGYSTRMTTGRHFEDMVALGVTSIGDVAGAYGQNHKERPTWEASLRRGELPTLRGHRRTEDDEERRRIILDLMCNYRLRFADYEPAGNAPFHERYRTALAELAPMQDDGLVELTADGIRVCERGRLFLRNLCMPFDAHLQEQRACGQPTFSRTV